MKPVVFSVLILLINLFSHSQQVLANPLFEDNSKGKTLVIGKISTNPKKHYRYLKPLATHVLENLKDLGYSDLKVLMARDRSQMLTYLRQGKVDWLTESTFPSVYFHQKVGTEYLLIKWKKGIVDYQSVFFTRKDSNINSLSDLKGKVIAFQDRHSSSAFYIPAYTLIQQGFNLVQLTSYKEKPPPDAIGYVFAKEEVNMSAWVHKNIVDAGVFSNLDWSTEDHNPTPFRNSFKQIYQSEKFASAIESVRSDLPENVKQRIKIILLNMHKDPRLADLLYSYQKTAKFDEITPDLREQLIHIASIIKLVDETLH